MRFLFLPIVLGGFIVALLWASQMDRGPLVINRADEYRLVLRLGRPIAELSEAGLAGMYAPRIPFVDEVLVFDKKIQYLNAAATEIDDDETWRSMREEGLREVRHGRYAPARPGSAHHIDAGHISGIEQLKAVVMTRGVDVGRVSSKHALCSGNPVRIPGFIGIAEAAHHPTERRYDEIGKEPVAESAMWAARQQRVV